MKRPSRWRIYICALEIMYLAFQSYTKVTYLLMAVLDICVWNAECWSETIISWVPHNMSKLYLVHLRPLGLHEIFLVVLNIPRSQLSQVAMGQHGTSWEAPPTLHHPASPRSQLSQVAMGQPGTSHYLPPPCQSQVQVVPTSHGTTLTWDIPGHPTILYHSASPRSKLSQVATGQPGTSHYLTPMFHTCTTYNVHACFMFHAWSMYDGTWKNIYGTCEKLGRFSCLNHACHVNAMNELCMSHAWMVCVPY